MFKRLIQSVLGPRVPAHEPPTRRWRYAIPTVLLLIAAAMLIASYTQPYWNMTLFAPQYPGGLHVHAYLDRLEGDVREIDLLNHYIGMRPLEEAAQLERETSLMLIIALGGLLGAAIFIHSKWAALLALPAVGFPAGFLGDLWFWLHNFGQNLDPKAPLSSSIKPFTPPVLGEGVIGNFRTVASVDTGWWMALAAACVVLVGLYFHRRAYKPLVDTEFTAGAQGAQGIEPQMNADERELTRATTATARPVFHQRSSAFISGSKQSLLCVLCASAVMFLAGAKSADAFDLQQAIDDAEPGSVLNVPAGVYPAPIKINQPLTVVGVPGAIIDGGGDGHIVVISSPDVTFRGFTVRGSGASLEREHTGILVLQPRALIENNIVEDSLFGISLKGSHDSVVAGNTVTGKDIYIARRGDGIRLWGSNNALIVDNAVSKVRDVVVWYSEGVHLLRNRVSHSRYGLHFMYTHDNVLEENVLEENSVGAFLMYSRNLIVLRNVFARNRGPSGYGLGLKDMQGVVVEDNVFVANRVGAYLDNPPVYLPEYDRYTRNVFAYNDIGLAFQPSVQRTAVYGNSFIENIQQVAILGGGELRENRFTHEGRGNYWSDYRGYDFTGDGIGEMPYQAESLWDNLMDREPALRLFLYSPAQQAVEMAARAFPVVRPRPLFTDDAPLVRPVRADVPPQAPRSAWPMWTVAGGLLGVAGLVLFGAKPQAARGMS
jgi:nitrous oxidase accessory protein